MMEELHTDLFDWDPESRVNISAIFGRYDGTIEGVDDLSALLQLEAQAHGGTTGTAAREVMEMTVSASGCQQPIPPAQASTGSDSLSSLPLCTGTQLDGLVELMDITDRWEGYASSSASLASALFEGLPTHEGISRDDVTVSAGPPGTTLPAHHPDLSNTAMLVQDVHQSAVQVTPMEQQRRGQQPRQQEQQQHQYRRQQQQDPQNQQKYRVQHQEQQQQHHQQQHHQQQQQQQQHHQQQQQQEHQQQQQEHQHQPQHHHQQQLLLADSANHCEVCGPGKKASGMHYGARTCEACKVFFRRTMENILDGTVYTCVKNDGMCDVTESTFNYKVCRRCRLEKCWSVGMTEAAFRCDRTNRPSSKRRARHQTQTTVTAAATPGKELYSPSASDGAFQCDRANRPSSKRTLRRRHKPPVAASTAESTYGAASTTAAVDHSSSNTLAGVNTGMCTSTLSFASSDPATTTVPKPATAPEDTPLMDIDQDLPPPPPPPPSPPPPPPQDITSLLIEHILSADNYISKAMTATVAKANDNDVCSSLARSVSDVVQAMRTLLIHVTNWARQLPEFIGLGPASTQADVLRQTWMDLVTAFVAMQHEDQAAVEGSDKPKRISLGPQLALDRDCHFSTELGRVVGRLINEVVMPLRRLQLTEVDMACVRGLLLLCPEKHGKDSDLHRQLTLYQDGLMCELMSCSFGTRLHVDRDCDSPATATSTCLGQMQYNRRHAKLLKCIGSLRAVSSDVLCFFMKNDKTFFNPFRTHNGISHGVNVTLETLFCLDFSTERDTCD